MLESAAAWWGNAESVRVKIEAASARVSLLFMEILLKGLARPLSAEQVVETVKSCTCSVASLHLFTSDGCVWPRAKASAPRHRKRHRRLHARCACRYG